MVSAMLVFLPMQRNGVGNAGGDKGGSQQVSVVTSGTKKLQGDLTVVESSVPKIPESGETIGCCSQTAKASQGLPGPCHCVRTSDCH